MAAAALQSTVVGLALRRAATPPTSRISSASIGNSAGSANSSVRRIHSGGGQQDETPLHWTDPIFGAVALTGMIAAAVLVLGGRQSRTM